jgi:predicted phosphodiesterase
MKILVLTDIHEDYDAARNAWSIHKPDLVLDCGDHKKIENLFELTPHYYIQGNHEPNQIFIRANDFPMPNEMVSGTIYTFEDELTYLNFSGIGGNYTNTPKSQNVNEEDLENLQRINGGSLDVLLLHESPFNVLPNRGGYELTKKIIHEIKRIKPKFVFSGHTNLYKENSLEERDNSTKVINLSDIAHGYGILEKEGNSINFQRVIFRYR